MDTKKKIATAALAAMFSAGVIACSPSIASEHDKATCKGASGCKGKAPLEKNQCKEAAACKTADGKEKHACKGKNSCKGNGADGKNECKGHGSCATDGTKPEAK